LIHAQFRRENPCNGWGHEIPVNAPETNIVNKEQLAWDNNYVILEAEGTGHYIGCNLSVTNFQGTWWGEGDDMIWVYGYKWPPDLYGTGQKIISIRRGGCKKMPLCGIAPLFMKGIPTDTRLRMSIISSVGPVGIGGGEHMCKESATIASR
jgi:hypothetical protein